MKYAVSLYSYQTAMENGMDLEGCLKAMKKLPVPVVGIEALMKRSSLEQMPYKGMVSEADQARWLELMQEYQMKPSGYASVVQGKGYNMYKDGIRRRTNPSDDVLRDQVAVLKNEIDYAVSLGFDCIRSPYLYGFYEEAIRDSLLYACDKGAKWCVELHAPLRVEGELITSYLEMVDKTCPEAGGIIPDFGIFVKRMTRPSIRRALNNGADPALVERIDRAYDEHADMDALTKEIEAKTDDPNVLYLLRYAVGNIYEDPNKLRDIYQYIRNVHLKWYEVNEAGEEESIDFAGPLKVLKDCGYDGYLTCEYEGHIYHKPLDPNEEEQVRRALILTDKLWAEV